MSYAGMTEPTIDEWVRVAGLAVELKRREIEKRANDDYDAEPDSYAKVRRGRPGHIGRPSPNNERDHLIRIARLLRSVTDIGTPVSLESIAQTMAEASPRPRSDRHFVGEE